MAIEYRELTVNDDFEQCLELQRQVFGFTETELISPLILRLIARNDPPMGLLAGAFNDQDGASELVTLIIGLAVEEPGALYIALGCVKPAYQDGVVGMKTMFRFREIALARGLSTIYAVHEPLEFNLARLYYGRIGYRGCGYSLDAGAAAIPMDKMKARWELDSPRVSAKLAGAKTEPLSRMLEDSPIARADRLPDAPRVLVELPPDFLALKRDDPAQAARVRQETRAILDELVNNRKYAVSDCVTGKMDGERRTFYVLEQPSAAQSSIRR